MNKCSKCGAEMKEQAKFCKACGTGIEMDGKKARVMAEENRWKKPAMIAGALVLVLAGAWAAKNAYMMQQMGGRALFAPHRDASARLANAVAVKDEHGSVAIPLATLDDGKAHFYALAAGGKTITFFAMKASDGSIRTAFDACVACNHAKLGYRQEGGLVVCNNCGMGFNPTDVGKVTGGCSPIPVNTSTDGKMLVFKTGDLEAGAQYF